MSGQEKNRPSGIEGKCRKPLEIKASAEPRRWVRAPRTREKLVENRSESRIPAAENGRSPQKPGADRTKRQPSDSLHPGQWHPLRMRTRRRYLPVGPVDYQPHEDS